MYLYHSTYTRSNHQNCNFCTLNYFFGIDVHVDADKINNSVCNLCLSIFIVVYLLYLQDHCI